MMMRTIPPVDSAYFPQRAPMSVPARYPAMQSNAVIPPIIDALIQNDKPIRGNVMPAAAPSMLVAVAALRSPMSANAVFPGRWLLSRSSGLSRPSSSILPPRIQSTKQAIQGAMSFHVSNMSPMNHPTAIMTMCIIPKAIPVPNASRHRRSETAPRQMDTANPSAARARERKNNVIIIFG